MRTSPPFLTVAALACVLLLIACIPDGRTGSGPSAPPLEGTTWILTHLTGAPVQQPPGTRLLFLRLDRQHGRVKGFGGCNTFFGAYSLDNGEIDISGLGGTRMHCPGRMEMERRFLKALERASGWSIQDGRLKLFDPEGGITAEFQPAPEESG